MYTGLFIFMYILFSINFCYKNVQREPKLILSCITEAVIVGWDCRRDEAGQQDPSRQCDDGGNEAR